MTLGIAGPDWSTVRELDVFMDSLLSWISALFFWDAYDHYDFKLI